jgi:acetoin utilization deacetylase AcuC-like enzyme
MRVTTEGYAAIIARLRAAADQVCSGRIAAVTEGGYHLQALAACLEATLDELSAPPAPVTFKASGTSERAKAALAAVRAAQKPYWPAI